MDHTKSLDCNICDATNFHPTVTYVRVTYVMLFLTLLLAIRLLCWRKSEGATAQESNRRANGCDPRQSCIFAYFVERGLVEILQNSLSRPCRRFLHQVSLSGGPLFSQLFLSLPRLQGRTRAKRSNEPFWPHTPLRSSR